MTFAMLAVPGETARWRSRLTITDWPLDKLAYAHRRALADGLWLPLDGDVEAKAPRSLRRLLRRLPVIAPTKETMARYGVTPDDERVYEGNVLTTAGITRLWNLLCNIGATQAYDATHTRVMIGDGGGTVPTVAASDTDLVAAVNATNRWCQLVTGANVVATNTMTATATIAAGNGNFAAKEWGIDQGTASAAAAATAPLLNHRGIDLGTKSSSIAQTYAMQLSLT